MFTALAVAPTVRNRTSLAIRNVIRQLSSLRLATLAINNVVQTFPSATDPERKTLLDALAGKALTK